MNKLIINSINTKASNSTCCEIVPLGQRLIVRKIVPFGALFWCHFSKGHCFSIHFLYKNSALKGGTKMVPFQGKGHCFSIKKKLETVPSC